MKIYINENVLNEENNSDEIRDAVAKHFDYSLSLEFADVIQDLVDRALLNLGDDTDISDAVARAIDEGLIYTDDIWKVKRHYEEAELKDITYELLFDDIQYIVDKLKNSNGNEVEESTSKRVKKSKKLNEGPGAGYEVRSTYYNLTGNLIDYRVTEKDSKKIFDCNVDMKGTVDEFYAESYGSSTGILTNLPIVCNRVIFETPNDVYLSDDKIIDVISETLKYANNSFIYGGGWSHSTYDGTLSTVTEEHPLYGDTYYYFDELGYEDDVSIWADIKLEGEEHIQKIDKLVDGYGYDVVYTVFTDDVPVDDFDDEDEAVEYAKKYGYDRVERAYRREEFNGDVNYDFDMTVWEKEDDDEVEEGLTKNSELSETFKLGEHDIQNAKVYNRFNYTIQEVRIDNKNKTFERGNFSMGRPDKKFTNRQEYERFIDQLKGNGYTEIKSEYKSLKNKSNSIEEDTVKKSNGKWTNRGDDGEEHGEFKTKKAADAQRKAMYAKGFKGGESVSASDRTKSIKLKDISTNLRDDGTLEIYVKDKILAEISDGRESEDFVIDVLDGMGYIVI